MAYRAVLTGEDAFAAAHVDISISADGFRVTGRHVHHVAPVEIHDRVSLGLCIPLDLLCEVLSQI